MFVCPIRHKLQNLDNLDFFNGEYATKEENFNSHDVEYTGTTHQTHRNHDQDEKLKLHMLIFTKTKKQEQV